MKAKLKEMSLNRTYILLTKLMEMANITEHKDAVELVNSLINDGVIEAVKSSKDTFKQPVIKTKYRLIKEEVDYTKYINELNFVLYHKLDTSYYRQHLDCYVEDRNDVLKISKYMAENNYDIKNIPMSVNERSLCIFNDEKRLLTKDCLAVLNRVGISLDDLNVYRTPEPFFYYYNKNSKCNNVLIVENKDSWYTIRELIREEKLILGMEFKAVIYGEGRKILSSFADISYEEYSGFNSSENNFYYFGDIDKGGLFIFLALRKMSKEYDIKPFISAYRIMLHNINLGRTKEYKKDIKISKEDIIKAFNGLNMDEINTIIDVCSKSMILPQEIVNNKVLRSYK